MNEDRDDKQNGNTEILPHTGFASHSQWTMNSAAGREITEYAAYLLEYNNKVNLVSRQITQEELLRLISETLILEKYIAAESRTIIDAGSGGGLMGIPVAIMNPQKNIFLVETKKKKTDFLEAVNIHFHFQNMQIVNSSIEEFLKKKKDNSASPITLISRGFPDLRNLVSLLKKGFVNQVLVITSENKIKKIEKDMVNLKKKTYNIPLRSFLKILKLENVSRET